MCNTPPKFGGGGQSAVKVTENENEEKKHKYDKKRSWKKKIWSHWYSGGSTIEAFSVASETRPSDQKYLRKASTCLQMDNFTLIYKHVVPASGDKQQKKVLFLVLRYCPGSTATR